MSKPGCLGCGLLVVIVLAIGVAVAGGLFLSVNIFLDPDVRPASFSKSDGFSAQNKLFEVVLRQMGRSARTDPIALTEREANAFLSRHLEEVAGLRLAPIVVRFTRNEVLVQGQTPLRNLLTGPPFAQLAPYVPGARLDQPVWVTVRGRIVVEPDAAGGTRHGRVELTELALGKQPVSSILVWVMMGPVASGLLRWPVPAVVRAVEIEDGRVLIRTR
jgi:hypothetical protein